MSAIPLRADVRSTEIASTRQSGHARVILCVSDTGFGEKLRSVAAVSADVESLPTLDRVAASLSRDPCSLVIMDTGIAKSLGNAGAESQRNSHDFANLVLANPGGTQVLVVGEGMTCPAALWPAASSEIGDRITVLSQQALMGESCAAVVQLALRQADVISLRQLSTMDAEEQTLCEILGGSRPMRELFAAARRAALTDIPILVCGEPGTGASLIANSIHDLGHRAGHTFVRTHSRAMTPDILNELLCIDSMEAADTLPIDTTARPIGGSLFLEDLESLPLALHKPLCRFVSRQQELIEGSQGRHRSIVRIIASTHLNLDLPSRQTLTLEILLRGLNAQHLFVPPLRDRLEDIEPLAEQFFTRWALQEDQPRPQLTRTALESLKQHDWPGNVRELYNVLRNTAMLAADITITVDMLRPWMAHTPIVELSDLPRMTLAEMERQLIETTFTRCGGNREQTADSLDIGLRTLSGKLREYGYPPRGGPGSNLKAA